MTITPLYDRVLIRPLPADEVTSGGIILPDSAQPKPTKGTVVAVGKGRRSDNEEFIPLSVQKSDTVLYGIYGGTPVDVEGEELIIMKESDIFGIITL